MLLQLNRKHLVMTINHILAQVVKSHGLEKVDAQHQLHHLVAVAHQLVEELSIQVVMIHQ